MKRANYIKSRIFYLLENRKGILLNYYSSFHFLKCIFSKRIELPVVIAFTSTIGRIGLSVLMFLKAIICFTVETINIAIIQVSVCDAERREGNFISYFLSFFLWCSRD